MFENFLWQSATGARFAAGVKAVCQVFVIIHAFNRLRELVAREQDAPFRWYVERHEMTKFRLISNWDSFIRPFFVFSCLFFPFGLEEIAN